MKHGIDQTAFSQWRPHPWHGVPVGREPPGYVNAYIEITPFDAVKYEIDVATGYLHVDRPQRTSSLPPALYGFIPRTHCGNRVAALSEQAQHGDGDALDICVISERPVNRSEIIIASKVIGIIQTTDHGEADDKIIAVMEDDAFWGEANDAADIPDSLLDRLRHYFQTYKLKPGQPAQVTIEGTHGRARAFTVVQAAIEDYDEAFRS